MSRKGRPRNIDAKRRTNTTTAARNPVDYGTDELTKHREGMHGMAKVGTEHPVDILAAKGLLADRIKTPNGASWEEEHGEWLARNVVLRDSGAKFAMLYRQLWGSNHASAMDPNVQRGRSLSGVTRAQQIAETRYKQCRSALSQAGRPVLDAVFKHAVELTPLPNAQTKPEQYKRQLDWLKQGLLILAELPPVTMPREELAAAQ